MALIDIAKLNAEVDKLIEKQNEEIKRIDVEIELKREARFEKFMKEMEEYAKVVELIQPVPEIPLGEHDNGYGTRRVYYLWFDAQYHSIAVSYYVLGDKYTTWFGYHRTYKEVKRFGGSSVIDSIVKWYFDHHAEFEQKLTEACLKAIKDKAEAANERMKTAEKTRSFES